MRILLLGSLSVEVEPGRVLDTRPAKMWELLSFLALNATRMHKRELLANLLWDDKSEAQAKKSLRHILWQLQHTLTPTDDTPSPLFVRSTSVGLDPNLPLFIDTVVFESAYDSVRGQSGYMLSMEQAQSVRDAVALYRGDLLAEYQRDWLLTERVRLQDQLLTMLHKLCCYTLLQGDYETGIRYAERILRIEPAQERTHRMLMILHCLVGEHERAEAQYQRCCAVLQSELSARPSHRTHEIHAYIREGKLTLDIVLHAAEPEHVADSRTLQQLLSHAQHIERLLQNLQRRVRELSHRPGDWSSDV